MTDSTMPPITLHAIDARTFEVHIAAARPSIHRVTVQPDYVEKLVGNRLTAEQLVERSFRFLLEREPNTSILSTFELSVIARYFPEYEKTIARETSSGQA